MSYAVELFKSNNISLKKEVQESSAPSRRATRRNTELKRVSNKRLKEDLLPDGLLFPTYKEGLKDILAQKTMPWWLD